MATSFSFWRVALVLVVVLIAVGIWAWYQGLFSLLSLRRPQPPQNAILVIAPYRYQGTWVFDDPQAGLVREPFVAGIPEMIDVLVKDVPNAEHGFRLLFSARPFPDYQRKVEWVRAEGDGHIYRLEDPPMEGWLCPAMFKYFRDPPPEIYVKAEPLGKD